MTLRVSDWPESMTDAARGTLAAVWDWDCFGPFLAHFAPVFGTPLLSPPAPPCRVYAGLFEHQIRALVKPCMGKGNLACTLAQTHATFGAKTPP